MSVVEKVTALLEFLSEEQIRAAPPATRQRLAQACRHIVSIAERQAIALPKAGVLHDLWQGKRGHG